MRSTAPTTLTSPATLRSITERLRDAVDRADLAAVAALADSLALAALRAGVEPMAVAERDRSIRRLRSALAPRLSASAAAALLVARAARFGERFRLRPDEVPADAINAEIREILIRCGSFPSTRTIRRILAKSS